MQLVRNSEQRFMALLNERVKEKRNSATSPAAEHENDITRPLVSKNEKQ